MSPPCYARQGRIPEIDGVTLLESIRDLYPEKPVIMISATIDINTISKAYNNGCNDYLKKPFDMDELMLRITALLRRLKGKSALCVGSLCIDEEHKSVVFEGKELTLTVKEFQLLSLMMRNADKVVTKEMITAELWSASESVSSGAIRVYINRLKSELGPESIENIRGVGYKLVS